MKASQRAKHSNTFLHLARIIFSGTIVDYRNPQRKRSIGESAAQRGKISRQATPFIECGNHQMD
jgi:hypothetical protein